MLGIMVALLGMSSLAAGSYKIGVIKSTPIVPTDLQKIEEQQNQYNMSLVVIAVAAMMALCGILMSTTGWNPFDSFSSAQQQRSPLAGLL